MFELSDFLAFLLGVVVGVVATLWWAVRGWSGDS